MMEKDPLLTTAQDPISDPSDPKDPIGRLDNPVEAYLGDTEVENPRLVRYLIEGTPSYMCKGECEWNGRDRFFSSLLNQQFFGEILGNDRRIVSTAVSCIVVDYLNLQWGKKDVPSKYWNRSVFPVTEMLNRLVSDEDLRSDEMSQALSCLLKYRLINMEGNSFYHEKRLLGFYVNKGLDCSVFQDEEVKELALKKIHRIHLEKLYALGYDRDDQESTVAFLKLVLGEKDYSKMHRIMLEELPILLVVPTGLDPKFFCRAERLLSYEEACGFYPYTEAEYECAKGISLACIDGSEKMLGWKLMGHSTFAERSKKKDNERD